MDLGQYPLQVFVSLLLVLCAALVALICDFLKRNNEQLRELAIELRVRREEDQRRPQSMLEPARRQLEEPIPPMHVPAIANHAATAPPPASASRKTPVASPKKDWNSLLARSNHASNRTRPKPVVFRKSLMKARQTEAIPAGFQPREVLSRLMQARPSINGLVISIGVNVMHQADGPVPNLAADLIPSLIRPGEFACQSSEEEFLLLCPSERGASAHRRLGQIAQQLWDFQLSSLGQFSILFSWGGIEVRDEPIDEAVASAYERMQETRSRRKLLAAVS